MSASCSLRLLAAFGYSAYAFATAAIATEPPAHNAPSASVNASGASSPARSERDASLSTKPVAAINAAASPPATAASATDVRTGVGHPAVIMPATSDEATVSIVLRDVKGQLSPADLAAGLLTNASQPELVTRPTVELQATDLDPPSASPGATSQGTDGSRQVRLLIRGLFPFGNSTVPILYQGREIETLRFSKPGLILKSPLDEGHIAREKESFPLVLANPSGADYAKVQARLRFLDSDLCTFVVERFESPVKGSEDDDKPKDCNAFPNWATFSVPRYADITLRATAPDQWFLEPGSWGLARDAKRHGVLTLRFLGENNVIHEQNLPFDVSFKPTRQSVFWGLVKVGLFLLAGAVLSLMLRVSLPNMKRKRVLEDQLEELGDMTRRVSSEVDSPLRVLLRVDRLALEEIRRSVWVGFPSYADSATRVERALPALKRRIEAVQRLDATLALRRILLGQNPAPTRLDQIELHLDAASETLKQDTLTDENWVFIDQHLQAAQKFLREPSQEEKDAFAALLSDRWKETEAHFGRNQDDDAGLKVPRKLASMKRCFPGPQQLPSPDDKSDGKEWIQGVGTTRADLQLYALALLRDLEFLVPDNPDDADTSLKEAMTKLTKLLATPAIENLRQAQALLRQLAEHVDAADIERALVNGRASIQMDPAIPRPNQRIRFSVRFWDERLNVAAARDLLSCQWTFNDTRVSPVIGVDRSVLASGEGAIRTLHEDGWSAHHYFESDVGQSQVIVSFRGADGVPIVLTEEPAWYKLTEPVAVSRRSKEKWVRSWLEIIQLGASLLVPLATLASQTLMGGAVGDWWQLVAIGFASDTIKNILVGKQDT